VQIFADNLLELARPAFPVRSLAVFRTGIAGMDRCDIKAVIGEDDGLIQSTAPDEAGVRADLDVGKRGAAPEIASGSCAASVLDMVP
jgi:hypothetical protein